jgi:hypothetical protein
MMHSSCVRYQKIEITDLIKSVDMTNYMSLHAVDVSHKHKLKIEMNNNELGGMPLPNPCYTTPIRTLPNFLLPYGELMSSQIVPSKK